MARKKTYRKREFLATSVEQSFNLAAQNVSGVTTIGDEFLVAGRR